MSGPAQSTAHAVRALGNGHGPGPGAGNGYSGNDGGYGYPARTSGAASPFTAGRTAAAAVTATPTATTPDAFSAQSRERQGRSTASGGGSADEVARYPQLSAAATSMPWMDTAPRPRKGKSRSSSGVSGSAGPRDVRGSGMVIGGGAKERGRRLKCGWGLTCVGLLVLVVVSSLALPPGTITGGVKSATRSAILHLTQFANGIDALDGEDAATPAARHRRSKANRRGGGGGGGTAGGSDGDGDALGVVAGQPSRRRRGDVSRGAPPVPASALDRDGRIGADSDAKVDLSDALHRPHHVAGSAAARRAQHLASGGGGVAGAGAGDTAKDFMRSLESGAEEGREPGPADLGASLGTPGEVVEDVPDRHRKVLVSANFRPLEPPVVDPVPQPAAERLRPFLIAGCYRCGTHTLWLEMLESPHVVAALRNGRPTSQVQVLGRSWNRASMMSDSRAETLRDQYLDRLPRADDARLRSGAKQAPALTVDATPSALALPLAAEHLSVVFGEELHKQRVIVVLRNPLDRMRSHYASLLEAGAEMRDAQERGMYNVRHRTFEQVVVDELEEIAACREAYSAHVDGWWYACLMKDARWGAKTAYHGVVWNALYGEQLRHWWCTLRAEAGANCAQWGSMVLRKALTPEKQNQMLVLGFDEVTNYRNHVVDRALQFVGLPAMHGTDGVVRANTPQSLSVKPAATEDQYMPSAMSTRVAALLLQDLLSEDAKHLEQMLGRPVPWSPTDPDSIVVRGVGGDGDGA